MFVSLVEDLGAVSAERVVLVEIFGCFVLSMPNTCGSIFLLLGYSKSGIDQSFSDFRGKTRFLWKSRQGFFRPSFTFVEDCGAERIVLVEILGGGLDGQARFRRVGEPLPE
jgi:hypothetical protein